MKISTFNEKPNKYNSYLTFTENKTPLTSESADEVEQKTEAPQLSYLRIECDRIRPGMSDFIIRVATPKYEGSGNTIISIRGTKGLAKYEHVKKLATVIGENMKSKGDATHKWESLDADNLADMLASCLKFFALNTSLDRMQFTTEALS